MTAKEKIVAILATLKCFFFGQYASAYRLQECQIISVYNAMIDVVNKIALYLSVPQIKDISDICCDEGYVVYKESLPFVRCKLLLLQGTDTNSVDIGDSIKLVQNCINRMLQTGMFDHLTNTRYCNDYPMMYVDNIIIKNGYMYIDIGITNKVAMQRYIMHKTLTRKEIKEVDKGDDAF